MKVPFFRPAAASEAMAERLTRACGAVLRSGVYVSGPRGAHLEERLSTLLDGRPVVAVNSGSDALLLALRSLGVGHIGGGSPDDEVLLPSYTFAACGEAVVSAGARPVFVDSASDDFLPPLAHYQAARGPRTRAILAVGLFGDATGLPELADYCRAQQLWLIEDVAQCLGAESPSSEGAMQAAGTWGDATAMSFYPTKTLGAAGDAGALAFRDPRHADTARLLSNHGYRAGNHQCLGQNSRMDELQACLLHLALDDFPAALARRRAIAARYRAAWSDCDVVLPRGPVGHAWNYFVLTLPGPAERQALADRLADRGVDTRIYYAEPLHRQPGLRPWHTGVALPHAERFAGCSLALPLYPMLGDDEVGYVIDAVRQVCRGVSNEAGRPAHAIGA